MGLNDTPSSERVHIGFFGRRNAGKSSVVNAVTGQELSVVSEIKGTTTDPVSKAMELLPMGPVVIIDTPGYDDVGALGEKRVKKTAQVLNRCDCAVLVVDGAEGKTKTDEELIALFEKKALPYLVVYNKSDLATDQYSDGMAVSALTGENIFAMKEAIARLVQTDPEKLKIVGDCLAPGSIAVLVVPVDSAAPKGRLILPQQQVIRDVLEANAIAMVTKESELAQTLRALSKKPGVVITDSQVFEQVSRLVPEDILLTSFSILMARYKGFLNTAVEGVTALDRLENGDKILISEGCTHHRQCEDIGTVKLPKWIAQYTNKDLRLEFSSGKGFPEDLSAYRMVIHCGGCMLNEREMRYRMKTATDAGIPFTNYGISIAYMKGILKRSLQIFPDLAASLR